MAVWTIRMAAGATWTLPLTRTGVKDGCLAPQAAHARRFDIPLEAFPCIVRIETACLASMPLRKPAPRCSRRGLSRGLAQERLG